MRESVHSSANPACHGRPCVDAGRLILAFVQLLALWLTGPEVLAAAPAKPSPIAAASSAPKLADAELIDQDGKSIRFASQAVGDRLVVINFVYTSCGTICPLVSANFKRLQDKLATQTGREVWLISISLDPATDTPARLREYAARYKPRPGWLWLTGTQHNVEQVLKGLGTTTANFRDHAPLTLVGDARTGRWSRLNTLVGPEQIRSEINALLAARKSRSGYRSPTADPSR